jgi:hypothetical protein
LPVGFPAPAAVIVDQLLANPGFDANEDATQD